MRSVEQKQWWVKNGIIDVYGHRTVALGVFMPIYFAFILFLPYFRFWSVLPKL